MATIKLTAAYALQVGNTPHEIVTYGGELDDVLEVPDDIAALIVANGAAVLVEPEPEPEKAKPRPKKSASK